jgi:hypothetical protein
MSPYRQTGGSGRGEPADGGIARRDGDRPEGADVKLIVARDQQALYDYFRWGFAETPGIQVIRDRRLWTRRERAPERAQERAPEPREIPDEQRRGSDRRRQPGMRAELLARGFVIAR